MPRKGAGDFQKDLSRNAARADLSGIRGERENFMNENEYSYIYEGDEIIIEVATDDEDTLS